ncbi:hypothetical protein BDFB_007198, partial [Asbolus verrucosus]
MATSNCTRFALKHGVFLLAVAFFADGFDGYSNSFISPNSAKDLQSQHEGIKAGDRTSAPEDILLTSSITSHTSQNKVKRSAEPILSRTTGIDSLLSHKNVGESLDSNDVELSGRVLNISPSKTDHHFQSSEVQQTILSGEGSGAPQGRSLKEPQEIRPTATAPVIIATSVPRGRQANPDIQDIITGIVKLLNGNVNVQANTAPIMGGRPLRPLSTRINNRGPPRITDVPALPPDFDVPAPPLPPPPLGQMPPPITPTRIPTPYPFDIPPHNTSPVKRPGLYRPVTIPPWNRRKPPSRRPIPPYKPMPPFPSDIISLTTEKPIQDILTLDLGSQLQSNDEEVTDSNESYQNFKKNQTEVAATTNNILSEDKEITDFEKNKEKKGSDERTPVLESSIQEVLQTLKEDLLATTTLASTPTEQLPKISSSKPLETITTTQLQTNIVS